MSVQEPKWYRYAKGVYCGTLGGIALTLIGHPFDTLKVRLQVQTEGKKIYNGLYDCVLKTMKWEGVGGFYQGVGSPLAGQMFIRATFFTAFYETLEYLRMKRENRKSTLIDHYFAGMSAGVISAFVESPMDLFKQKMQTMIINQKMGIPLEHNYKNFFHCGTYIYKNYGVVGCYQGFSSLILRNIIGHSLYFASFEAFKRYFTVDYEEGGVPTIPTVILSGCISGTIFWIVVYNIDVIRGAMRADHIDKSKRNFKNSFDCLIKLYKHEGGYARLWKGFLPCLFRSAPANGIMLYVVDASRNYFPAYA